MDHPVPPRDAPDDPEALKAIYASRFGHRTNDRLVLWETLVSAHFQRYVDPTDVVLDLAAGYCQALADGRI